jgi:hypothetical protein
MSRQLRMTVRQLFQNSLPRPPTLLIRSFDLRALSDVGYVCHCKQNGRALHAPSLQQEMAVDKKKLDETDAGKTLSIVLTMAKERFARDLKE